MKNLLIAVKRTEDKVTVKAEGIHVELVQIRNAKGEPIKVSGLPAAGFPGLPYLDHVQYKTLTLSHKSENEVEQFDFLERNGYTAKIDATSGPAQE